MLLHYLQGLQPGIDQTEAGTGKSSPLHHDARSGIAGSKLDAGVGEAGRTQLISEDPAKHSNTYDVRCFPVHVAPLRVESVFLSLASQR